MGFVVVIRGVRSRYLQLLAEILSIVGTALIVWAVVTFLRISDWNSDHFQVALRDPCRGTLRTWPLMLPACCFC